MTESEPQSVLQLVYTSRASVRFSDAMLAQLLVGARRYNAAAGITGVLMVHDGFFAQCLEGPPEEIRELFGRIERDPRHTNVVVMFEHPSARRAFPEWFMGCTRLTDSDVLQLSTARWERLEAQLDRETVSPGFILLQSLWRDHKPHAF